MHDIRRGEDNDLLSSSSCPVRCIWNSQRGGPLHTSRDQHSLVAWKDSLTECNFPPAIHSRANVPHTIYTIRFVGERLLNVAAIVAEKSAILYRISDQLMRNGLRENPPETEDMYTMLRTGPIAPSASPVGKRMGSSGQADTVDPGSLPIQRSESLE